MTAFAQEWLAGLFGNDVKRVVKRAQATRWSEHPWTLGAFSVASPGGQWARMAMMEPVRDRVFFAGEAVHETLWGTVGGAWQSGERAAEAALRKLGLLVEPRGPAKPAKPRQPPKPRAPEPSTSSILR
jgi:monoamine oxidase